MIDSHYIKTYESGIIELIINTTEKWLDYHRYSDDFFEVSDYERNSEKLEVKLPLEDKMRYSISSLQEKDKIILAVANLNIRAGEVSIGDFSKNLAIENLGQNNLFSWLKARGFLMMDTTPYQQYVERGYFVRKPSNKPVNGEVRYKTMLTPRGTVWLTKILRAEYNLGEVA